MPVRWQVPTARYLTIFGSTAIAIVFFWWLADLALERHLLLQAARQMQQTQQGWRWEFEHLSDLVGQSATQLEELKLERGRLSGSRRNKPGFLSLNFRGRRLDARRFHLLQMKIHLSKPAAMGIYHRETLTGAVLSTKPIALNAGWQLLEIDLAQLDWQANTYQEQVLIAGPVTTQWGGNSGVASSIRIHPAIDVDVDFEIDWIRVLPGKAMRQSLAPPLQLDQLDLIALEVDQFGLARPQYLMPDRLISIEKRLWFRDQLNQKNPAAVLLPASAAAQATLKPYASRPNNLLVVAAIIIGLSALLITFTPTRRIRQRSGAAIQLIGLLALGTVLLTWSDIDRLDNPALWLTLVVLAALLLALSWQARAQLPNNIASDSKPGPDTLKLLMLCLLPLTFFVIQSDQAALPSGIGLLQRSGKYLIWSTLQQFVLCIVLLGTTQRLQLGQHTATLTAAVLFGLAHYPNFALMAATLILAQFCLWLYQQHGSLLPGIALHAISGTLYLELMPETWLRSGAIGERFFF